METVVRTWKSGGRNVMSLAAAATNLARNHVKDARWVSCTDFIEEAESRLLAGEAVETPLAVFRLAGKEQS